MSERKAISKGKRFEVFARDGFACQYCGRRPPDVVLEVDHIEAVANGGTNEDLNLITACYDCNRGKSAKELHKVEPRPDADLHWLKAEQERVEIERYLKAKDKRDKAQARLITALNQIWNENIDAEYVPLERQWKAWLCNYAPEEIEKAINLAAPKYTGGYINKGYRELYAYISGILKNRSIKESD